MGVSVRGVIMGLRLTQRDESHAPRHRRKSRGPLLVPDTMDSRFRGDDVVFERTAGDHARDSHCFGWVEDLWPIGMKRERVSSQPMK